MAIHFYCQVKNRLRLYFSAASRVGKVCPSGSGALRTRRCPRRILPRRQRWQVVFPPGRARSAGLQGASSVRPYWLRARFSTPPQARARRACPGGRAAGTRPVQPRRHWRSAGRSRDATAPASAWETCVEPPGCLGGRGPRPVPRHSLALTSPKSPLNSPTSMRPSVPINLNPFRIRCC